MTNGEWARGLRAPIVVLFALVVIAGFASQAEAKKKAPVDPSVVAAEFDAAIDALVDDTEAQIDGLTASMTADIDTAVGRGSPKQVLRLQDRYESRIRKLQRKQQNALAKVLTRARKSLARFDGRPVALMQVEDLAAELATELDAAAADLSDHLAQLVFHAMIELAAMEAASP